MSQEAAALFSAILREQRDPLADAELNRLFPFYPLNAPGMPLPGPDFVAHAMQLGDAEPTIVGKGPEKRVEAHGRYLEYLYRRALYDNAFALPINVKGRMISATFVPGHIWGGDTRNLDGGPRTADVLVLGKHPGQEEISCGRNFVGPTSEELPKAFQQLGITDGDTANWYVTNLVKHPPLDKNSGAMPVGWIKNCAPLLAQELRLVRPRFILCLGSEASKYLLGTNYSVTSMVGRVMEYTFPIHEWGSEPEYHTCKVMTALHPAAVYRKPELADDFIGQLGLFWQLVNGGDVGNDERDIDHGNIYTERELAHVVDELIADPSPNANIIAVDGEWHGDYPTEPGAYLRTIQFSNRDKWARTVVLRYQGGQPAFKPGIERAIYHLNRLLKSTPTRHVRVGGHFFRSDLPWLIHQGLDLRAEYAPSPDEHDREQGGWDSSLMYHAYNETARYKLEDTATRLTTCPRYDSSLQAWKKDYCSRHKINAEALEGYGECPDYILHPDRRLFQTGNNYACYDPDVTRRVMLRLYGTNGRDGLLARDWHGNDSWRPYWLAHRASPAFLEMEMTGFMIDRDRADEIASAFMITQDRLLRELQAELNWPNFNPKSQPQCATMLFGPEYGARLIKATGEQISRLPEGAVTLRLKPVKSTQDKPWAQIEQRGEARYTNPSTDKETLGILGHANPLARKLRDLKFVGQVLTSVLRRPTTNAEGMYEQDANGNYIYAQGMMGMIHADGRVRTHLFQTKETGRASSARPPLQNISSRREDDYHRILRELHKHPIRSILCVPPGFVGIDADLTGAELAVLAWLCQDHNMIDHVRRNNLPEDHPDHYDIHSRQACKAFRLTDVIPTKTGMKDAGKKGLRVAAKNVNFGIPYGRGALAIARQCAEEGVDVTEKECEVMIDAYFEAYPGTWDFLAECRTRSQDPGWMAGPYGRYRRFMQSNDRQVIGEQERQAQNFPIQNGVADAVSIALTNLIEYRNEHPDLFYLLMLQIHDAIVTLVPIEQAEHFVKVVLPECMINRVPFWPKFLDGRPMAHITEPYRFGIDVEVFTHWGEGLKGDKAKELGLHWLAA